jgi:hypothetical protein
MERKFDILRLGLGLDEAEETRWGDQLRESSQRRAAVGHDEARVRRLKSLGLTMPLHELEANKGQRGWDGYNLVELGLIAIDAIADRQELDAGATPDDIKELLVRYAEAQRQDGDGHAIAAAVLDALVEPRAVHYGDYGVEAQHTDQQWAFCLVREVDEGRGVHLRATDPAINLLVGALDIDDLESVHAAAETLVSKLIERGKFDDARRAAVDARLRSIQYTERLRQLIADARNSIATVDLSGVVLPAISDARRHLLERVDVEAGTLEQLRAASERLASSHAPVDALQRAVSDCLNRHQRLHRHLQHAPEEFERLQVEQAFELGRGIGLADPEPEVLTPTLRLTAAQAHAVLERFEAALMPPQPPVSVDLDGFARWLLRSKRPPAEQLGEALDEPEFAAEPDPNRFDARTRGYVDEVLELIESPVPLSELLTPARASHDESAARLLAMRALAAFAPEPHATAAEESLLLASPAGALRDATHAGDDLLIERLRVESVEEGIS